MIRTEEQVKTSGVISLALAANKLQLLVAVGEDESSRFQVDRDVLGQWDEILKETIDFLQASEAGHSGKSSKSVRFLSRAQFIEQIYSAAPQKSRASSKELGTYLSSIRSNIQKVAAGKPIPVMETQNILTFAGSIADEAIRQAARFHRDPHIRAVMST